MPDDGKKGKKPQQTRKKVTCDWHGKKEKRSALTSPKCRGRIKRDRLMLAGKRKERKMLQGKKERSFEKEMAIEELHFIIIPTGYIRQKY